MKSYLKAFAAILFVSTSVSALASDVPVLEGPASVPMTRTDYGSFEGWFVGGHVGNAFSTNRSVTVVNPGLAGLSSNYYVFPGRNGSSLIAGLSAGYNWQAGPYVVGSEFLGEYSHGHHWSGAANGFSGGIPASTTARYAAGVDAALQARARFGYVVSPAWLLYGFGGLGVDFMKFRYQNQGVRINTPVWGYSSAAPATWGIGTGVEWAAFGNIHLKAEYEYRRAFNSPIGFGAQNDGARHLVRLGVNYTFGR